MGVPAPLTCPDCRSQLRCLHRNERSLYARSCDLCKREIVAMYPGDAAFPVYCTSCFFSDRWDPLTAGTHYDSGRPFFRQYHSLLHATPHLGIINKQAENSEYCNYAYAMRNCYLTYGSHQEQDCLYEAYSVRSKDSVDFLHTYESELVYECMFCAHCYRCLFLDHCEDCSECLFSRELKGCRHCLFCSNLRQQEYCIFNEPHAKEDYERKLSLLQLHTCSGLERARRVYLEDIPRRFPVRALFQVQCMNCEGSTLSHSQNLRRCFFCDKCEDCAYGCQMDETYSSLDMDYMGYDRSERCTQTIGCQGLTHCIACNACWHGGNLAYCQFCYSCTDCFGCASLHQKRHCILNVQYSEQEYDRIVRRIVGEMQREGSWGSFFPADLSPFGYNESMAMDWFPLSEDEARGRGLHWRERKDEMPKVSRVIPAEHLPDAIDDIPDDVLHWAIQCAVTKRPFRIVKQELSFYRKMHLPLPRLHPDERHRRRIARRHGRKLYSRTCAKCSTPIQTTYQPSRPEVVYCEQCYLQAVY